MNSIPSPPVDELASDPWYGRLKEYLIGATGMAYYENKDADLARRIRRRFAGCGLRDCASYLERLRDPALGPVEMDALVAEITIGESYLFRHREHFEALRDVVLPAIIAGNAATRRLRIWCAGCSDGAEPYSLSLLLRRELGHLVAGWNLSILGTDINRQCLTNARAGRFEEWSFRSTPGDVRRACFVEHEKHWTIAPEYREGVSFQFHNLAESPFPPLGELSTFDLIICRNVMIYFNPDLMGQIVGRFHDCLSPGGWLLVGPSEPNMTHFTAFRAVNAPGVTLYQKAEYQKAEYQKPDALPADRADIFAVHFAVHGVPTVPGLSIAPGLPAQDGQRETTALPRTLAELRRLSDLGDWVNAARCGLELLQADNLNPLVHLHYGLVLAQMGEHAGSERSLRKAIYLDRKAALAHYHLGLLLQGRGDLRQAARCFDNAVKVLEFESGDATLPEADGITAAELSMLARVQLTRGQAEILRMEAFKEL